MLNTCVRGRLLSVERDVEGGMVWKRLTGGRAKRRCQSKLERLVRVLFGSHLRGRGIQTVCSISPSEEREILGSRREGREDEGRRTLQLEGNCCCYRRFIRTIARPINESAPQALDGCPPVRPKRKQSVSVGFTTAEREESASAALDESSAFIRDARGIPKGRLSFLYICVSFSLKRCFNPNYVDAWPDRLNPLAMSRRTWETSRFVLKRFKSWSLEFSWFDNIYVPANFIFKIAKIENI